MNSCKHGQYNDCAYCERDALRERVRELENPACFECKEKVWFEKSYRCTDCHQTYHHHCAEGHFKEAKKNYVKLAMEKGRIENDLAASQAQVEELRGAVEEHLREMATDHPEVLIGKLAGAASRSYGTEPPAALERRDRETWNRAIEAVHKAIRELVDGGMECTASEAELIVVVVGVVLDGLKRTEPECEVPDQEC